MDFWYVKGLCTGLGCIKATTGGWKIYKDYLYVRRECNWTYLTSYMLLGWWRISCPYWYALVLLSGEEIEVKLLSLPQIGKKSFVLVYEASSFSPVTQNSYWLDVLVSWNQFESWARSTPLLWIISKGLLKCWKVVLPTQFIIWETCSRSSFLLFL